MGALHGGHRSLIERAREEAGFVVVSMFVNPLQFDDPDDLAAYPRDERADLAVAGMLGVDVAFVPPEEEMYPEGEELRRPDPGPLGTRYEGAARPGHFAGVLAAVARLFDLFGPCRAYFGEKDWQQLFLVRRMVDAGGLPVEVVACPTVRERDGLALSSRNARLSPEERAAATCLFSGLAAAAELARAGERSGPRLVAAIAREIGAEPLARIDYAAVVDEATFEEVQEVGRPARALAAALVGRTRLIDNLRLPG
jgi:pantoate--beta-alanine ligase